MIIERLQTNNVSLNFSIHNDALYMSNKEKVDKFLVEICQLILLLVYTLDITHRYRYRPDLVAFSFTLVKENYCVARSSPRERRSSAPHLYLQICPSLFSPNKKRLVETSRFLFVISVHFRYHFSDTKIGRHASKIPNISFASFDRVP